MSQSSFRPDENVVFAITTKMAGTPADLPDGVVALGVQSLFVIREGEALDIGAGAVTFTERTSNNDGQYLATVDRSVVTGTQQNGDIFAFTYTASVEGELVHSPTMYAAITIDLAAELEDIKQRIALVTPPESVIFPDPSQVDEGVVFGEIGNEQVGTSVDGTVNIPTGDAVVIVGKPSMTIVGVPLPGLETDDCQYTDRSKLNAMWGGQNIEEWADLENCEDSRERTMIINDRITLEIKRVTAYIDDSLRPWYCNPFKCPVPQTIEDIASALVGHNLRDARFMNEADPVVTRKYERAMNTLHQLKEGSIRVPGFQAKTAPSFEDFL